MTVGAKPGSAPRDVACAGLRGRRAAAREAPAVRNAILRALPGPELDSILPELEPVDLRRRQTLHQPITPMEHVYFVEEGLVTVSGRAEPDRWVDLWLVGSEGLVGLPVVLGNFGAAPFRRTVAVAGRALRLRRAALGGRVGALPELRRLLLAYVELVVVQTAQGSLCNATHSLTQRLSRWLLLVRDRLGSDALPLTHQAFARLLGVRRPSVTTCLSALQERGAIRLGRGCTHIGDARELERLSCGCNRLLQSQRKRLLGEPSRRDRR